MRRALRTCLTLVVLSACSAGSDARGDGKSADPTGDSAALDSGGRSSTPRLASDGSITVLTMSPLTPYLRMAADSFAAREAILVLLDTLPEFEGEPSTSVTPSADVVALSTSLLQTRLLAAGRASWSLPFARNRIVLAWRDSSSRAAEIDSGSWRGVLLRRGTRVGRVDPAQGALGTHTLLAMQLAELQLDERGLADRLLKASPAARIFPSQDSLLSALQAGALDVIWTYESAARSADLRWLNLGPAVDLGDDGQAATYRRATVVVRQSLPADSTVVPRQAPSDSAGRDSAASGAGADSLVVRGRPLSYALTVPRDVTNLAAAERFLRFLFSPDGQRILRQGPFDVIDPLIARGSGVPEAVAVLADSIVPLAADSVRPAPPLP